MIEDPSMDGAGHLREQAAAWFVRMRGPESDDARTGFEAWLAADPLHREAYSRIAEVFSLGKGLVNSPEPTAKPGRHVARGKIPAIALGVLLAIGVGGALLLEQTTGARLPFAHETGDAVAARRTGLRHGHFQTDVGQIRTVRLEDGSSVTLDTNSILDVSFDTSHRQLRLVKGRARFDVAHETRPFVVLAAAGTVTARGTLFDVNIQENGMVRVRLIRGAVDVAIPRGKRLANRNALLQRLRPGQQIVVADKSLLPVQSGLSAIDERWPSAELDCDQLALSEVAARANRYSKTQIVIVDQTLGALQVSGTFRIDNADKLAAQLAEVFDLHIERQGSTRLVLYK